MHPSKPFTYVDWLLIFLILGVGAGLRFGYIFVFCSNGQTKGPLQVQDVRVASENDAQIAPGYIWFRRLGDEAARFKLDRDSSVRQTQCLLGALTGLFYFLFARNAFQSRLVALFAGFGHAVYPLSILSVGALEDGVLTGFLLAFVLYIGTVALLQHGPFSSLLFGLALAGISLIRAAMMPFAFVGLCALLLRMRGVTRGWLCSLLAFLGFANGIAPWMVHQFRVHKEPLPFVEAVYEAVWEGSKFSGQDRSLLKKDDPAAPLEAQEKKIPRYKQRASALLKELRGDPLSILGGRVKTSLNFLFGESLAVQLTTDKETASYENAPVVPVILVWLASLFALAFFGWRWSFPWRSESILAVLALVWIPLPYLVSHAEMLHGPRLPLDGVLMVFASYALASLFPSLGTNEPSTE